MIDHADKSYLREGFKPSPRHLRDEKLLRARMLLGENYCLANPSTLKYKRAAEVVPNLAGRQVSALY